MCSLTSNSKKLCGFKNCEKCFNKSFASFDELTPTENSTTKKVDCWDYEKNDKNPWEVTKKPHSNFWFKCDNCPHSFCSRLDSITNGTWCPYCCSSSEKFCDKFEENYNNCQHCFNKSFASSELLTINNKKKVECWDYEKNDKNPWKVTKSTHSKFWFNCDNCPHSFCSNLANITGGRWCPYCCRTSKIFCDKFEENYNNCQHCFNKSFASSELLTPIKKNKKVDCWDYEKNNKKPWEVFKSIVNKFWFTCDNCFHCFDCSLNMITGQNTWCPYCCNPPKKFCNEYKKDYNNCQHCFNKSFASLEYLTINGKKKADCWHPTLNIIEKNNKIIEIKPWKVFKSIADKFWFTCDECDEDFNSSLNNIVQGKWCPHCKNKTALKLHKWLKILEELYPNYTIIITKEYKKKWCRNPDPDYKKKKEPCYYPYDFNIQIKELKLNIIIELDGRQHFEYVSHFDNNVEERQITDLYKMFQAFKNNHSFIRIFQEDVYNDNNDWENKLKDCIDKIIKSNHIMSLYVDNGNLYDIYRTRDPYKILKFKEVMNQIKNVC